VDNFIKNEIIIIVSFEISWYICERKMILRQMLDQVLGLKILL